MKGELPGLLRGSTLMNPFRILFVRLLIVFFLALCLVVAFSALS